MDTTRREFTFGTGMVGASLLTTPLLAAVAPATAKTPTDRFALVDPELRPWLEEQFPSKPPQFEKPLTLTDMRPKPSPRPGLPANAHVRMVPGLDGDPPVRVIVIGDVKAGRVRPAILHMHGGGYTAGRADDTVVGLNALADMLNEPCIIVTVDYRLAPETQYPGSVRDNFAALSWLHTSAVELGVDPNCIVVMGESAGGGHAAALCLYARGKGVPIKAQFLVYPMLDDRTGSSRPVPDHIGAFVWGRPQNRFGWSALLGMPAGSPRVPAQAAPARVTSLEGLPSTFIAVGSLDLFLQEDVEYARRLLETGISTELYVIPGAYHGFDIIVPTASVSRGYKAVLVDAIDRAFASPNALRSSVSPTSRTGY